jgi:hypothetical protein
MPRTSTRGNFRSEVLNERAAPGLIASARNFKTDPLKDTGRMNRVRAEGWQKIAWEFFDTVPEFHYSVTLVANLMSRAKLLVTKDGKPTDDPKAVAALAALGGGPEGQTELLRQYGIHFTVAGDSYLIGMDRKGVEDWFVAAASEISADPATKVWKVGEEELATTDLVIRAWRPHPQKRHLPDSPTRAALPVLAEIDGLTKHVAAQIDSRLAGAGILFIPEEMNIGKPPVPAATVGPIPDVEPTPVVTDSNPASDLMLEIMETASASLSNPGDASALVPIVVQVKGDTIKDVKHITFWTPLDEHAIELRNEAIRRLALGMDMPPEILMGNADSSHWNAWQTDEAAIKSHAEPLLFAITDALTEGYLRPALSADDVDDAELDSYAIVADTTEMRLRPNRSEEALELYDRGILSPQTVVRENGFDPDNDVMSDDERAMWMLLKVATGQTTPAMVAQALIQYKVPGITLAAGEAGVVPVVEDGPQSQHEARPTPSLQDHPTLGPPDPDESEAITASLVGPAFAMVDRALERAGNRLRNKLGDVRVRDGQNRLVAAVETYRFVRIDFSTGLLDELLTDAWGHCDRFAHEFEVDGKWLRNALDTYTRELLQFGRPNDRRALQAHLALTAKTRPEKVRP